MTPTILVVAKAPVPGLAKTRLARTVGDDVAADVAAAALLDTLHATRQVGWPVVVALTGDLDHAARQDEIRVALAACHVVPQRGDGLGERLAAAHLDAADLGGNGVVQIGMDTPQVTAQDVFDAGEALLTSAAVVGPASDGGWWLLAVQDAAHAAALVDVPMSQDDTCARTVEVLPAPVARLRELTDVDEWDDALALAAAHPDLLTSAAVTAAGVTGGVR